MHSKILIIALNFFLFLSLTSCKGDKNREKPDNLAIFLAPCFSPVIDSVRNPAESQLNLKLITETSGSQVAVRKVTELGRNCDLLMLADKSLFKQIASSHCTWRIDFLNDEIVLGVGIRAKRADDAEKNWVQVLLDDQIKIARVDENLGPIGYRTLLVWKLMEPKGYPGLMEKLKGKSEKPVENVENLAVLLKSGEADYGFAYKTTCINNDIRYITLDKDINLSSYQIDYSKAEVRFKKLKSGAEEFVSVKGEPITYSLSIPLNAQNKPGAVKFVKYILSKKDEFALSGFTLIKPIFFGNRQDYEPFKDITEYSGDF